MKILAVHSAILPNPEKQSQVDHWRIYRPLRELAKNMPDWVIEHSPTFIPNFEENHAKDQFTEEEFQAAFENLKQYDVIFSSYHPDPSAFIMMQLLNKKAGVQFVMDCDDDMFAINPDNPFWNKISHDQVYEMQRMIAHNPWLTTTNEFLANRFRDRRPDFARDTTIVIPNFINDDFVHPTFNNSPDVVIGYVGGSSHYFDLHDSGVLEAIQSLMHKHKNVRFKLVGMFSDVYTPKQRTTFDHGVRGTRFLEELYPTLNCDIFIAPLNDNTFNLGKSNIKWQEATRAGGAFVASNIGPYAETLTDGKDALLVENTREAWYEALEKLVLSSDLRNKLVDNATENVTLNWTLENNWQHYKKLFERVVKEGTNADHRTVVGLSAGKAK